MRVYDMHVTHENERTLGCLHANRRGYVFADAIRENEAHTTIGRLLCIKPSLHGKNVHGVADFRLSPSRLLAFSFLGF